MGPLENAETRAAEGRRGTGRVAAAHARAPLPPPRWPPPAPHFPASRGEGGARSQKYGAALSKGSTQKYNLGKLRAERTFERISQKYNREIVLSNGGGGRGSKAEPGADGPGPRTRRAQASPRGHSSEPRGDAPKSTPKSTLKGLMRP